MTCLCDFLLIFNKCWFLAGADRVNQTQPCFDDLHARVLSYFSAYKDLGNCNFRLTLAVQKANISCSSHYFFPVKRGFLDCHLCHWCSTYDQNSSISFLSHTGPSLTTLINFYHTIFVTDECIWVCNRPEDTMIVVIGDQATQHCNLWPANSTLKKNNL